MLYVHMDTLPGRSLGSHPSHTIAEEGFEFDSAAAGASWAAKTDSPAARPFGLTLRLKVTTSRKRVSTETAAVNLLRVRVCSH